MMTWTTPHLRATLLCVGIVTQLLCVGLGSAEAASPEADGVSPGLPLPVTISDESPAVEPCGHCDHSQATPCTNCASPGLNCRWCPDCYRAKCEPRVCPPRYCGSCDCYGKKCAPCVVPPRYCGSCDCYQPKCPPKLKLPCCFPLDFKCPPLGDLFK